MQQPPYATTSRGRCGRDEIPVNPLLLPILDNESIASLGNHHPLLLAPPKLTHERNRERDRHCVPPPHAEKLTSIVFFEFSSCHIINVTTLQNLYSYL